MSDVRTDIEGLMALCRRLVAVHDSVRESRWMNMVPLWSIRGEIEAIRAALAVLDGRDKPDDQDAALDDVLERLAVFEQRMRAVERACGIDY